MATSMDGRTRGRKTIATMSVEELCAFLGTAGVEKPILEKILQHKIDGSVFLQLSDDDLKELSPLLGDRIKLKRLLRPDVLEEEHEATSACRKIMTKPSGVNAAVLAKLFAGQSNKRPVRPHFDPSNSAVDAKRAKKPRNVTIVLLNNMPPIVPRGHTRRKLRMEERIKKLQFLRMMSACAVREAISNGFSKNVNEAVFLHCGQDNVLEVHEKQDLNGQELMELAGQGSIYLCENVSTVNAEKQKPKNDCEAEALQTAADEALAHLKEPVPGFDNVQELGDDCDEDEVIIEELEETVDLTESAVTFELADEDSKQATDDLTNWRATRKQQEEAYEYFLELDRRKEDERMEQERAERFEQELTEKRNEKVTFLKEQFACKFEGLTSSREEDRISIAVKFNDGTKTKFSFLCTSTVKDLYQFVFSKDNAPLTFSLFTTVPMQEVHLERKVSMLHEYNLAGSVVMVQSVSDDSTDVDCFLELLCEDGPLCESIVDKAVCSITDRTSSERDTYSLDELEEQRASFMNSLDTVEGDEVVVTRSDIFSEVMKLYGENFARQYPISVSFRTEKALDFGGVSREMYSSFWEQAYIMLFDGDSLLIPLVNSLESDVKVYKILGEIISHGYLVCGHLPVRIALPTLIGMLLGPLTQIPPQLLIGTFLDYISSIEKEKLKSALDSPETFTVSQTSELISILSKFGCQKVPTSLNLKNLIIGASNYFFGRRPTAITMLIHQGVPNDHRVFWDSLGVVGIAKTYLSLSVSTDKVLNILQLDDFDFKNAEEERIFNYLLCMVGNMKINALRNFLRFCTGSSVIATNKLSIIFSFGKHPFAHTCGNTLELPLSYKNYQEFEIEWDAILRNINEEWAWTMDGC